MKPKFALDLSHEGINLLHRRNGGWTLVGSVALDDPEMGSHLIGLRRKAAELESGGFTCKIIVPNSQILYTTLEAPGPDDIAREVQIRSGLDGLTPYPVGELVFDWRAAGERARVAVLARGTMDEAETFAVEHRFNPVSFVARPPQGEFSGEPFFGKTRAATKILGPTERVEPDASPVPRHPPSFEKTPASGAVSAAVAAAAAAHRQSSDWTPPALDNAPPAPVDAFTPAPDPAPPVPEPLDEPLPDIDPADDPFAELDAIQAELSGDPGAAGPAFRSRARSNRSRQQRSDRSAGQTAPPPLAPFPPTSDEAEAVPARKPRTAPRPSPKSPREATTPTAPKSAPKPEPEKPAAQSRSWTPPETARPAALDSGRHDVPGPEDDAIPARPGVAFSTSRGADGATTTAATPTARDAPPPAPAARPAAAKPPAGSRPAATAPPEKSPAEESPAAPSGALKNLSPSDRRRAEMAEALSRPLPGNPAKSETPPTPSEPGGRSSLSGAMRGAAGGLRALGHRRATREPQPTDSSMTALMRGAGSNEGRISPASDANEPDLLDPGVAAADSAPSERPAAPKDKLAPVEYPVADAPNAKPKPARAEAPPKAAPAGAPARPAPKPPLPTAKPAVLPAAKPTSDTDQHTGATSNAETFTVFGARREQESRNTRKYLGVLLTLVLLLVMAIIALWSSFFVDSGDGGQFNPGEEAAPAVEAPTKPAEETLPAEAEPAPADADAATEEGAAEETPPETATPDQAELPPAPQVLTQEEAEARYAETQIWQRAPETLAEPRTPGLDIGEATGPGTPRAETTAPAAAPEIVEAPAPDGASDRTAALPPPPADTVFQLDENGLVSPSPEGTVSPTGVIIFQGPPAVKPLARPETVPPLPATPGAAEPETQAPAEPETALAPATQPELPDAPPSPRPGDLPAAEVAAAIPQGAAPDAVAAAAAPEIETAAAAIDAAVSAATANFVNASELAVEASIKPSRKPANIDEIVRAATARAAAAPAAPATPVSATVTPSIPTSANVADQATTPGAINLRKINLLGISGPTNALKALVRLPSGSLATVKVGDRLDGGRVTSITSDGLTYQKGSRSFTLQLLPLG